MKLQQEREHGFFNFLRFVGPMMMQHKVAKKSNLSTEKLSYKDRRVQAPAQSSQNHKVDHKTGAANDAEANKIKLEQMPQCVCNHIPDMVAYPQP